MQNRVLPTYCLTQPLTARVTYWRLKFPQSIALESGVTFTNVLRSFQGLIRVTTTPFPHTNSYSAASMSYVQQRFSFASAMQRFAVTGVWSSIFSMNSKTSVVGSPGSHRPFNSFAA